MKADGAFRHGETRCVRYNPGTAPLQQTKPAAHADTTPPNQQRLGISVHEIVEVIFRRKERSAHIHIWGRVGRYSHHVTTGAEALLTRTIEENGLTRVILGSSLELTMQQRDHFGG